MSNLTVFEQIYTVVCTIPKGKVATYGQVAAAVGNPKLARIVGYALHKNPNPSKIPCYRVVNCKGEVSKAFAFGGANRQKELLLAEGIEFLPNGNVNMQKCCIK